MFAKPRPKKQVLPIVSKKRKAVSAVDEVSFDFDARQVYLTGFHKRKLQRMKWAQEQAAKKAREERIEMRKQLREERQREVENHVKAVSAILEEAQAADSDQDDKIDAEDFQAWNGIEGSPKEGADGVDYEDEYIDEDRYTTVKVEAISVTRDGLEMLQQDSGEAEAEAEDQNDCRGEKLIDGDKVTVAKAHKGRLKKKKFRYGTKLERSLSAKKTKVKLKAKFKKDH